MIRVNFYEQADSDLIRYAVIAAKYRGKWVFCRHKERKTWEFPGGHIEKGETAEAAAGRELYEETGALEYRLYPVAAYSVSDQEAETAEKREEVFGMLYFVEISRFGELPTEYEMEKIELFQEPPDQWTYPEIQPYLLERICSAADMEETDGSLAMCAEKRSDFFYRKAGTADIELLTRLRTEVLRAANRLEDDADMSAVERESRRYYETCFCEDSHAAWLVFDGERVVGTGGISFYQVMPTYHNISGKKAYIMNVYTQPDYRRKGIAYHILELLVGEAEKRKIDVITLEATEAGRPLYERFGFSAMQEEMELIT